MAPQAAGPWGDVMIANACDDDAAVRRTFSARQVHDLVRDLLRPNPLVFWLDLLASVAFGYGALAVAVAAQDLSPWQIVAGMVSALALYRASVFTHELVHLREGSFRLFRVAWNALVGIPLLVPSFLYYDHRGHHVNHQYGTAADSEYLLLKSGPMRSVFILALVTFATPLIVVARFLIVAPLSIVHPRARAFVWKYASSQSTINPLYRRPPLASRREFWAASVQEVACWLYATTMTGLFVAGLLPLRSLVIVYSVGVLAVAINSVRVLGAHHYQGEGRPMTYLDQLLDSTTIPGHPLLTELWAPLGMRYHALHHLVPSLPYHAMGVAHRRLMRELPARSPYRATLQPSLWHAIAAVWRGVSENRGDRRSTAA